MVHIADNGTPAVLTLLRSFLKTVITSFQRWYLEFLRNSKAAFSAITPVIGVRSRKGKGNSFSFGKERMMIGVEVIVIGFFWCFAVEIR